MNRRIAFSLLVIVVVIALTAAVTWAYFSGTQTKSTTITTATISLSGTAGFPLNFSNMLPGETQSKDVNVKNTGNRSADFYVQLLSSGAGTNFCSPAQVLNVRIEDLDVGGNWYNGSICDLFPGWSGSKIVKVGEDVGSLVTKHYRVHLTLAATADNTYQGASTTDTVHLIAVQYDGPAPKPDKQGGTIQDAWPNDTTLPDDDPNYP